jgi:hypothetical protein
MQIEQVENGYIVDDRRDKQVFKTLDELFTRLLFHFEGRSPNLGGKSFGRVAITRDFPYSDDRCGICGGQQVYVRGRYPGSDKREVCPTCLAERLDQIRDVSSEHYGQCASAISEDVKYSVEKEL